MSLLLATNYLVMITIDRPWELVRNCMELHGKSMNNNSKNVATREHILQTVDQLDSSNKKLPSRGIGISDECVYDQFFDP